jgi:hypothetical protein
LLGNGSGELDAIRNSNGKYSIIDISQYSDGKTYTIDISHNERVTQLIFEQPHNWKAQSSTGQKTLDESAARAVPTNWLEKNFTCSQLSRIEHTTSDQNEYFAAALVDILSYDKKDCASRPHQ